MTRPLRLAVLCLLASTLHAQAPAPAAPLQLGSAGLQLRGQPFRILSGELEYARIPREDWRDRLRKVRALGLNAITVYVFWNVHEPKPGVYDFSGQNDVAEFLREAQQEGLYVILRPGPYVCAEWDLGGYPAWLLAQPGMELRSSEPGFFDAATRWMHRLGQELAPLQASLGGPILAVQVENEYGSFGKDHRYLSAVRQLVLDSGFTSSLLYTGDGADVLADGSFPDLLAGIDFGTGDAARSVALYKKARPGAPVYVAEYWDGWFDHWGEKHQVTNAAQQESEIRSMLADGDSLSLYMIHGGTSWGWMNGANNNHGAYQPDVSSYDYDAPLDESGRPRPKYFALRQIIAEATHTTPPPVPESAPMLTLPPIELGASASLWQQLPAPTSSPTPPTMEQIGQSYGYILYRTSVELTGPSALALAGVHSYARVYLDGHLAGSVDRRLGPSTVMLDGAGKHQLDVLVENTGRINFTTAIRGERAGLTGPVTLAGKSVTGWSTYSLPLPEPPAAASFHTGACLGPCFFQASFAVTQPGDTFLNTERLGKGVIWVNGHLLGRYWNVGPMGSLFLPGAWLHAGQNQITIFDLDGGAHVSVEGQDHPTYIVPKAAEQASR